MNNLGRIGSKMVDWRAIKKFIPGFIISIPCFIYSVPGFIIPGIRTTGLVARGTPCFTQISTLPIIPTSWKQNINTYDKIGYRFLKNCTLQNTGVTVSKLVFCFSRDATRFRTHKFYIIAYLTSSLFEMVVNRINIDVMACERRYARQSPADIRFRI